MYWSYGAWCIGEKDPLQSEQPSNQEECMAFIETDVTHPTAIPAKVVWKSTPTGCDVSEDHIHFEVVEGIHVATGTVRTSRWRKFCGGECDG